MGNVLDQIKKQVFYDKPYNVAALQQHMTVTQESMRTLATITEEELTGNIHPLPVNPLPTLLLSSLTIHLASIKASCPAPRRTNHAILQKKGASCDLTSCCDPQQATNRMTTD